MLNAAEVAVVFEDGNHRECVSNLSPNNNAQGSIASESTEDIK